MAQKIRDARNKPANMSHKSYDIFIFVDIHKKNPCTRIRIVLVNQNLTRILQYFENISNTKRIFFWREREYHQHQQASMEP